MAIVHVPALHRDLTGGEQRVQVPGTTVREVIEALEARYPGMAARLCEGGNLRPHIAVAVDGEISPLKLRERVEEASQIHFLHAISGG